jgi:outer membrane lipoprotein-sorting protein
MAVQGGDPAIEYPVDWVASAESDLPGTRVLTFRTINSPEPGLGKLWVDAKTLAPVKGEWVDPHGRRTVTDTFAEFVLNADLPDETFRIPEGK